MSALISRDFNLARLGNAGDQVRLEAGEAERSAIAALAGVLSLSRFVATVTLQKTGPTKFLLSYELEAEVVQSCVVTLEPVASQIRRSFRRELHFQGHERSAAPAASDISPDEADEVENITSLHFDLAGPAIEEFLLALDPYPRRPGVEFDPGEDAKARAESPFAALKSLKPSK
ncbi:MAG: DUF177 domain-containing protein [Alphaproteobacteria bacterium]|nr:DUF177 domain-containing protein [Alphaproteobacteria bacterium]